MSAFCFSDKWKVARYCFLTCHTHSALPIRENGGRGGRDQKLYMLSSIMVVSMTFSLSRFVYDKVVWYLRTQTSLKKALLWAGRIPRSLYLSLSSLFLNARKIWPRFHAQRIHLNLIVCLIKSLIDWIKWKHPSFSALTGIWSPPLDFRGFKDLSSSLNSLLEMYRLETKSCYGWGNSV